MIVEAQLPIRGSRAAVWAAITDIADAASFIKGIEKIDLLHTPAQGLVGLKWRETRILFGKPAAVDKWITAATDGQHYTTEAAEGGFVFLTTFRIADGEGGSVLVSRHETRPQGFLPSLQAIPMKLFFRGVIRKAILKDLEDIKAAVEGGRFGSA